MRTSMVDLRAFNLAVTMAKLDALLDGDGYRAVVLRLFETYETLKMAHLPDDRVKRISTVIYRYSRMTPQKAEFIAHHIARALED